MVELIQEKTDEGTYEYYDEEEGTNEKESLKVKSINNKIDEATYEYYNEEEPSKSIKSKKSKKS